MNPANNFYSSSSSSFHLPDLNETLEPGHEQYGLIINHAPLPHRQAAASSSACPTFFNVNQTWQKVDQRINVPVEGSSAGHISSASSYQPTDEDIAKDHIKMVDYENRRTRTHGSLKWMSSKIRVMRKVMPSNKSLETDLRVMRKVTPLNKSPETDFCIPAKSIYDKSSNLIKSTDHWNISTAEIVRVCSDCSTTKTPLWRGGPQGPKSLCNACGIRQRKARKAMALAASQNDSDNVNKMQYYSSTEAPKIHNAEKKLRTSCHAVTQSRRTTATSKLSFKNLAMTLINKNSTEPFPRDEEEAALLLMALSSGLIYS